MTSTMDRTRDAGDRIGEIIHGAVGEQLDPLSARNLGRLVASCLFNPEGPILTGEDLEAVRPCEWSLNWRQSSNPDGPLGPSDWQERARLFDDELSAIAAARALMLVEQTIGEVRAVHLAVRRAALRASEWEEVGL